MNENMRVHKYPLPDRLDDWVRIDMPYGAEPLCVQMQDGRPCIWARVDPDAIPLARFFRIAGTGHDLGDDVGRYIGTFQLCAGSLVFHVFEEGGAA